MRTNWTECSPGGRGEWATMYATMNPKGHIVMSRRTFERLNEPKAVLVLFDEMNNRIGLKPTVPSMKNAFPVAKSGKHGGRTVRVLRMMQEFDIVLPETVQFFDVEIDDDGVLILNLRTARVSARAGFGRRKKGQSVTRQPAGSRTAGFS